MITRSWQLKAMRAYGAAEDRSRPQERRDGGTELSDIAALLRRDSRRKAARSLVSLAQRLTRSGRRAG